MYALNLKEIEIKRQNLPGGRKSPAFILLKCLIHKLDFFIYAFYNHEHFKCASK